MKFVKSLMSHAIEGNHHLSGCDFAMGSFFWFEKHMDEIRRVCWRIVSRLLAFIRSGKNQRRIIKNHALLCRMRPGGCLQKIVRGRKGDTRNSVNKKPLF